MVPARCSPLLANLRIPGRGDHAQKFAGAMLTHSGICTRFLL
ncbi:hypothetical protein C4K39_0417 [Pseudomonas sessilinigenes]|nr:hypothetical protein C4K39_0417 [Pseudomonas sessilinigenes]